ncbi:MAG: hypothetical protein R3F14_10595 [Polyangiaceae bacterium]
MQLALPDLFAACADIQSALRARTRQPRLPRRRPHRPRRRRKSSAASLSTQAGTPSSKSPHPHRLTHGSSSSSIAQTPSSPRLLLRLRSRRLPHREPPPPLDLFRPAIDRVLAAVTAECT